MPSVGRSIGRSAGSLDPCVAELADRPLIYACCHLNDGFGSAGAVGKLLGGEEPRHEAVLNSRGCCLARRSRLPELLD